MIEKTNQTQFIDQMNFLIENIFYIGNIDIHIDEVEICEKILDTIEKKARSVFGLNQLIENHYGGQYKKHMDVLTTYISFLYRECINQEIYLHDPEKKLNELFDELDREMIIKEQNDRSDEIEELLVEKYHDICDNENFYEYVRTNTKYKQYVEGEVHDVSKIVEKIGKSVKLKIEKDTRKSAINAKLRKDFSNPLIKTMDVYKKYINNGVGQIDT